MIAALGIGKLLASLGGLGALKSVGIIGPLLQFLSKPPGRYLAYAALVFVAYQYVHGRGEEAGHARAIAEIAAENKEAIDAAVNARAKYRSCDVAGRMRWDQVTGQCVAR